MSKKHTFYVLGAGASYGLIPMTPQLRAKIEKEYHGIGIYPTTAAPEGDLFARVIGSTDSAAYNMQDALLRNIPAGTLDLLVQKSLWRPLDGPLPPQYAVGIIRVLHGSAQDASTSCLPAFPSAG